MNYMFAQGFIGTRAPFFMDLVTLIVAALPLLVAGAIFLAQRKKYKLHSIIQSIIFFISVIVLIYFEYGVRVGGGFNGFMEGSGVSHNYAFVVLLLHIAIAVLTVVIWAMSLFRAKKYLQKGTHKIVGYITFVGITLTSLTGMWVYLILFVY